MILFLTIDSYYNITGEQKSITALNKIDFYTPSLLPLSFSWIPKILGHKFPGWHYKSQAQICTAWVKKV